MRLIDADKLPTKHGVNVGANYGGLRAIVFRKDIDNAPIVDAEPVKHGRWIAHGVSIKDVPTEACSECGEWSYGYNEPYCQKCGAKMTLD